MAERSHGHCSQSHRSQPGTHNAVFTASGMGQIQPFLHRQRLHQTVNINDSHDPLHIVGEHTQTYRHTHPSQLSRQVVPCPIRCLSVPKGCSTVRFRNRIIFGALLHRSCISSNTASDVRPGLSRAQHSGVETANKAFDTLWADCGLSLELPTDLYLPQLQSIHCQWFSAKSRW